MSHAATAAPFHRPRAAVRRARIGITVIFFIPGVLFANIVPRIPEVRERLDASEGELGLALLALAVGALLQMLMAGRLSDRIGPHRPLLVATILTPIAFAIIPFAGSLGALAVVLFFYGAAVGLLDVTMNLVGAGVERASGKKIFATFHGAFSLGGMVGALMGGVAGEAGVPLELHIVAVSAAGLLAGIAGLVLVANGAGEAPHEAQEAAADLPMAMVLILGLIAFAALIGEGVVTDWSAILLVDYREAGPGEAGIAFAAFSAAMTVGRFTGDRVIAALGRRAIVGWGGALAAAGLAIALSVDGTVAAAAGFAITGLGLSCMFPALLAAAVAASPHRPGSAMAAVATLGYFGFLVGPPAIGFGAEASSLPLALSGVVVLLALAAFGSLLMPGRATSERTASSLVR